MNRDKYKEGYDAIDWSVPLPEKYRRPVRETYSNTKSPLIWSDIPGYWSVASDKWVDGRAERREDLKRTGCQEAGDRPRFNDGYAKSADFARRHGMVWQGERTNRPVTVRGIKA